MKKCKKQPVCRLSEHQIQQSILWYLKAKGIFHWRANVGRKHYMKFGCVGQGDILGLTKQGIFFSLEIKDHHGKLSKEQIDFMNIIKDNNGIAVCVRCLKDIQKIL